MRIIFFGADRWFSGPVLSALAAAGHEVLLVVSKGEVAAKFKVQSSLPHRQAGKFKVVEAKTAEDISIKKMVRMAAMAETTKFSSRSAVQPFNRSNRLFAPDAIVLASFGPPFLSDELLNWPKYGCLNVHASLLPRWRGASPVFAALAAGDKETGVSIMRMTTEIDRGPILGQKKIEIKGGSLKDTPLRIIPNEVDVDTRETLTKRLGKLGGELIVETLKKLEKGQITEVRQPIKSPTPYTRKLTKESGRIDWSRSPIEIERFIRAAFPWPCAMSNVKFKIKNEKWQTIQNVKILKAHLERPGQQRDCHGRLRRPRNDVTLVIDLLQLPGKNPVTWKQFLAGHPGAELG